MDEAAPRIEPLRASTLGTPAAHLRALSFCAVMLGVFGAAWPYSEAAVGASVRYRVPAAIAAAHRAPPAAPSPGSCPDPLNLSTQAPTFAWSPVRLGQRSRQRPGHSRRAPRGIALLWQVPTGPPCDLASGVISAAWPPPGAARIRSPGPRAPPFASPWTRARRCFDRADSRLCARLAQRGSDPPGYSAQSFSSCHRNVPFEPSTGFAWNQTSSRSQPSLTRGEELCTGIPEISPSC
jgi:hypothetical protein